MRPGRQRPSRSIATPQAIRGGSHEREPEHRFAILLLPPENATGNWVKVVQRVPVSSTVGRRRCRVSAAGGFERHVTVDTHSRDPQAYRCNPRHLRKRGVT